MTIVGLGPREGSAHGSDEQARATRELSASQWVRPVRLARSGPVLVPTLTAWCYGTPLGATAGSVRLRRMEQASTLEVIDAIVVSWMPGAHRPRVTWSWSQEVGRREPSVLVALLRTAFAAVSVSASLPPDLVARCAAAGLDPVFLEAVAARLTPRSSSLLVLSGAADLSVVIPAVRQRIVSGHVTLMQAELPADGPDRLRAALGLETSGPD